MQHRRRQIALDERRTFESVTGATFTGRAVREARVGDRPAVVVEVAGSAHYTGECRFTVEADDPLGAGFLLR